MFPKNSSADNPTIMVTTESPTGYFARRWVTSMVAGFRFFEESLHLQMLPRQGGNEGSPEA